MQCCVGVSASNFQAQTRKNGGARDLGNIVRCWLAHFVGGVFFFWRSIAHTTPPTKGASQQRTMFPKSLAPPFLRVWAWKLDALTPTQHCICRKQMCMERYEVLFVPTRSRRDIRENSKTKFSTPNSSINRPSRSTWNLAETMLKTPGKHRYTFHCPICHP